MSQIPTRSRNLVKQRARFRCERCGGRGTDWHHRRSRSVIDGHTHCPCVGVWLCRTCHVWAHHHPTLAKSHGWIVSRWEEAPSTVEVHTYLGPRFHNCEGEFVFTDQGERA